MARTYTALFAVIALAAPAAAQEFEPIKLTLTPAGAPVPSLKYRLLPDSRTLAPGNAATIYQRSLAMMVENTALHQDLRNGPWTTWLGLPPELWPKDDVAIRLRTAKNYLRELDYAAHYRECDWQLSGRPEGFELLLPDLQGYRVAAGPVAVQARQMIALGDFDGAAKSLQSGLALGKHMADGPLLIQVLVGIAISQIMLNQVDMFVQAPNAPNLYWALTALPRPWADLYSAVAEDLVTFERTFPGMKKLDGPPMTTAEITELQEQFRKFFVDITGRPPKWNEWIGQTLLLSGAVTEARASLLKQGYPAARLDAMPVFQVVALYSWREYQRESDELLKWLHIPRNLNHPAYDETVQRHNLAFRRIDMLFSRNLLTALNEGGIAPAIPKVLSAVHRIDRKIAALRTVEAIRMQTAKSGKLPATLTEVTAVPVPNDPVTGKPFEYKVADDKATLDAPPPAGQERNRGNALTYAISLRK